MYRGRDRFEEECRTGLPYRVPRLHETLMERLGQLDKAIVVVVDVVNQLVVPVFSNVLLFFRLFHL